MKISKLTWFFAAIAVALHAVGMIVAYRFFDVDSGFFYLINALPYLIMIALGFIINYIRRTKE